MPTEVGHSAVVRTGMFLPACLPRGQGWHVSTQRSIRGCVSLDVVSWDEKGQARTSQHLWVCLHCLSPAVAFHVRWLLLRCLLPDSTLLARVSSNYPGKGILQSRVPGIIMKRSGEIAPEGMKRLSQSRNNAQLRMHDSIKDLSGSQFSAVVRVSGL